MMSNKGSVHEPQAELLSAEEALKVAARLREKLRRNKPERVISIHCQSSPKGYQQSAAKGDQQK
jgi:hypothetical protein